MKQQQKYLHLFLFSQITKSNLKLFLNEYLSYNKWFLVALYL